MLMLRHRRSNASSFHGRQSTEVIMVAPCPNLRHLYEKATEDTLAKETHKSSATRCLSDPRDSIALAR